MKEFKKYGDYHAHYQTVGDSLGSTLVIHSLSPPDTK